jgi:hypothetical protein
MALGDKERAKELLEKNSSQTVKYSQENTRQIHLASNKKDGESVAFLEVPNYVPLEIEKALDIEVDELVSNRKDLPDVVLRSLYESQSLELAEAYETIEELETDVQNLQAELAQVTSQRDNERELRIAAETALAELENLYIALSDQFRETVIELQKAIERSAQEAVERVSLEARFEAIKARLEASLLAIEIAEEQLEEENVDNLVSNYYEANSDQMHRGRSGEIAWYIPTDRIWNSSHNNAGRNLYWDSNNKRDADSWMRNDRLVIFLNFGDEEKNITVNNSDPRWKAPQSFKIPARITDEDAGTFEPGFTSVRFGFKWDRDPWSDKFSETNDIKFTDGDSNLVIKAFTYKQKKVQNKSDDGTDKNGLKINNFKVDEGKNLQNDLQRVFKVANS